MAGASTISAIRRLVIPDRTQWACGEGDAALSVSLHHRSKRLSGAVRKPIRSALQRDRGSFVLTLRSHPKLPRQDRAFNSSSDRLHVSARPPAWCFQP